ncbi:class I ribonucleotide reductase maintenance protein YfaE [Brackiella oedipodis]|uniref:class I ribonucleotide reductase maintenance protein YfaE n=1 Tax=Brackiella oedipodis TaxID=124225 RepID=UPI0009FCCFAB|nr:class I ribonucleotide reductase maintenance protein YfaE [Brackiella oedipodis]
MSRVFTQDDVIDLLDQESILQALERQGYVLESQCRSGYCGACRLKKLTGEVDYLEMPLAFINPDEILPCCSRPKANTKLRLEVRRPSSAERQKRRQRPSAQAHQSEADAVHDKQENPSY